MDGRLIDDRCQIREIHPFAVRICAAFILVSGFVSSPAWSGGTWRLTPRLIVRETFSDNINLAPSGAARSAFVTEINPGFFLRRIGGKTQVNLNYQLQNVLNAGGAGGDRVNHQLQGSASTVIEPNRLFVTANTSVSQQNIVNTGPLTTGNLNSFSNRADVYTFSVSPTWTPYFDGYVNAAVRLGYNFVGTSSSQASDTNNYRGSVDLSSGYRFNRVYWRLLYNDDYSQRSSGGDVRFRSYQGEVRYNFDRKYAVFVQGGYFDNSLPNVVTSSSQNGEYYTLGVAWTPSWRFGLQGSYGKNLYAVDWHWVPSQRTRIDVGFRHSKVGTNVGSVWNALFSHRTARVTWVGSYSENTTTVQNILLGQGILNTANTLTNLSTPTQTSANFFNQPFANAINQSAFNPVVTQSFASNPGLPTFTNNILIQKLGTISVFGGTGKSQLGLTAFSSRREDQTSLVNDDSIGLSAYWNWRFQPRTNTRLLLSWNRNTTNFNSILVPNSKANFYIVNLGVTRNIADYFKISRGIFGSLDYRFAKQDSSNSQFSYTENSIAATLLINF